MKKFRQLVKEKFNWDERLDCTQQVSEYANRASAQVNRRMKWLGAIGNTEVSQLGLALEDGINEAFQKQLRREGCFGKCTSFGGILLRKGNPDKCALKDIDILN